MCSRGIETCRRSGGFAAVGRWAAGGKRMESPGRATGVWWQVRGGAMAGGWELHGDWMEGRWSPDGEAMGIGWGAHGGSMGEGWGAVGFLKRGHGFFSGEAVAAMAGGRNCVTRRRLRDGVRVRGCCGGRRCSDAQLWKRSNDHGRYLSGPSSDHGPFQRTKPSMASYSARPSLS